MPAEVQLNQSAPVTLDGSGNGTAKLGPRNARETWYPTLASVGTNQAAVTAEAQCKVYEGSDPSQANFVGGTLSGSTGDSTDGVRGPLEVGEYVWAVWTGGDPGAQAYLNVQGTRVLA